MTDLSFATLVSKSDQLIRSCWVSLVVAALASFGFASILGAGLEDGLSFIVSIVTLARVVEYVVSVVLFVTPLLPISLSSLMRVIFPGPACIFGRVFSVALVDSDEDVNFKESGTSLLSVLLVVERLSAEGFGDSLLVSSQSSTRTLIFPGPGWMFELLLSVVLEVSLGMFGSLVSLSPCRTVIFPGPGLTAEVLLSLLELHETSLGLSGRSVGLVVTV